MWSAPTLLFNGLQMVDTGCARGAMLEGFRECILRLQAGRKTRKSWSGTIFLPLDHGYNGNEYCIV